MEVAPILSWHDIEERAKRFVKDWESASRERGEAQSFYNDFFDIFGVSRRRVARFEEHVQDQWGKHGFIDLFWPGVLIVEHKSRGESLVKAAGQAGDYFDALENDRKPRYQLVSDFYEFYLLDRDSREEVRFPLSDLPANLRSFAFMLGMKSLKRRNRETLNADAAQRINKIYNALASSRYPIPALEALLTRIVFCLFADSTGIFQPRGSFADVIESRCDRDLGSALAHLFEILDTPHKSRQEGLAFDLSAFPYVDGGLFRERLTTAIFSPKAKEHLLEACAFDWSQVSPAIFSELFQSVLSREEIRNTGSYGTSEENILKVMRDLWLDAVERELAKLVSDPSTPPREVKRFVIELSEMEFFDPACGCGNFLVIAYREVRSLELRALKWLLEKDALPVSERRSRVDVDRFSGIEIRSYSARIAVAAMWMADHMANNELCGALDVEFRRVPLTTEPNIICEDALTYPWDHLVSPNRCLLFSNPPYKGPKQQSVSERSKIREIAELGGHGGTLDYVCGWILKAAEFAKQGATVGLVTVNSVVQGEQAAQLWPVLFGRYGLEITFAHQEFKWESETSRGAQVHVVIIGLVEKTAAPLWRHLSMYPRPNSKAVVERCKSISPYLICGDQMDDPHTVVLEVNRPVNGFRRLATGTKPIDGGYYILTERERAALIKRHPASERIIRPFIGTEELLQGKVRYLVVPSLMTSTEIRSMKGVKDLVEKVGLYRMGKIPNKAGKRQLRKPSTSVSSPMSFHITRIPKAPFLVIPEVSSERRAYVPIAWVSPPMVPSNLVKILENATLAEFGLLTSAMHMAWLRAVGGKLEGRLRYSIGVVYNTFPVLIDPKDREITRLARNLLEVRERFITEGQTLEGLYDQAVMPPALKKAHARLDSAVDKRYIGRRAKSDNERVVMLMNEYRKLCSLSGG